MCVIVVLFNADLILVLFNVGLIVVLFNAGMIVVLFNAGVIVVLFNAGLKTAGHIVVNPLFFDTITIHVKGSIDTVRSRAVQKKINFRYGEGDEVCMN